LIFDVACRDLLRTSGCVLTRKQYFNVWYQDSSLPRWPPSLHRRDKLQLNTRLILDPQQKTRRIHHSIVIDDFRQKKMLKHWKTTRTRARDFQWKSRWRTRTNRCMFPLGPPRDLMNMTSFYHMLYIRDVVSWTRHVIIGCLLSAQLKANSTHLH